MWPVMLCWKAGAAETETKWAQAVCAAVTLCPGVATKTVTDGPRVLRTGHTPVGSCARPVKARQLPLFVTAANEQLDAVALEASRTPSTARTLRFWVLIGGRRQRARDFDRRVGLPAAC